jgi:hypothetical protein
VAEDMSVIFDELMRLIAREYIIKNMVSKFWGQSAHENICAQEEESRRQIQNNTRPFVLSARPSL